MSADPVALAALVKQAARAEGFDLVGIAQAGPLPREPLDRWHAEGWDAGLPFMQDSREERLDPSLVLPGVRSVVVVAVSCRHPDPEPPDEPYGVVARYARGRDYHNVVRRPLRRLRLAIEKLVPGSGAYTSCDTRPVMEKPWAQAAGLGWIGKNGLLIAPPYGSFVLLGSVLTTIELAPDAPHPFRCGSCTACLDGACPTDALPAPGFVDARRCIAFHTIEHRDPLPADIAANLGGRLFGCDACQDVCPWNHRPAPPAGVLSQGFVPREGQAFVPLSALLKSTDEALAERIRASPLVRTGVEGLRRTARAIAGESE